MKIKELVEKMDGCTSVFFSLFSKKDNKVVKNVMFYNKEDLLNEIGEYTIIEYSVGVFKDCPVFIINYEC